VCIIAEILPVHALTGCDTVACYFRIGKGNDLKVLRAGSHSLSYLGVADAPLENVIAQVTEFLLIEMCGCDWFKLRHVM